jgi:transcriptional regulator with XRE-family HTH domain
MKSPIPNSLKEYRQRAGLKQVQVAQILNFSTTDRISKWESGNSMPDIINLFRLSTVYHCPPHKLYSELFRIALNGINPRDHIVKRD